jgi:hypothetical protein
MRDALEDVPRFSHYVDFDLAFGKAGRCPKGEDSRYLSRLSVVHDKIMATNKEARQGATRPGFRARGANAGGSPALGPKTQIG